jgi:hypothetical protein
MNAQHQITSANGSESCNAMVGGGRGPRALGVLLSLVIVGLLGACATGFDKDGVPTVDLHGTIVKTTDAKDIAYQQNYGGRLPATRMVSVENTQISIMDFVRTYCPGKDSNTTCARAKVIINLDASKGPLQKLPQGI